MKKLISVISVLMCVLSLFSQAVKEESEEERTLTLYAYDTFCGEWGSEESVIPAFEEKTGIKVRVVSCGTTSEMINKLLMEGENTPCDVILGVSDDEAERVYPMLSSFDTPLLDDIDDRLEFDSEKRLLPFDWGTFAFVFDTESGLEEPSSLRDLTKDEYRGKVILIDPRTSVVGLGLLLWTYNALGDEYLSWWEKMEENALVIASGWSSAYGLFTEGEAPIVISYTTSPVYHVMNEKTTRYKALLFKEGHEATIEGIGIVKTTEHREEAEEFVSFILSDAQETLAVTNSMYPALSSTSLPDAYDYAPVPEKFYASGTLDTSSLLASWSALIAE